MTKKAYKTKMSTLELIDDAQRKSVTCSLLGHSNIVETCFGDITCARCGEQLGDMFGG